MPYVDPITIAATTRILTTGTKDERKTAIVTHPISPPAGQMSRESFGIPDGVTPPAWADYSKPKFITTGSIMFIKLRPDVKKFGAMTFALKRPSELKTENERNGWIPIWWLPWDSKLILKVKILDVTTDPVIQFGNGIADVDNPDIFFTAALSGCSVFAVGGARNPSLYHAGSYGEVPLQNNETTEEAWRRMLGRQHSTKNIQSIGKSDYVSERKMGPVAPGQSRDKFRMDKATRASQDFQKILSERGRLTKGKVDPWGMVFGLRDNAGDWTFTLVKNATLEYYRIQTTKKMLIFKKQVESGEMRGSRTYSRDGVLTDVIAGTSEQAIVNQVCLGYQEFFPGRGQIRLYDQTQIQVF